MRQFWVPIRRFRVYVSCNEVFVLEFQLRRNVRYRFCFVLFPSVVVIARRMMVDLRLSGWPRGSARYPAFTAIFWWGRPLIHVLGAFGGVCHEVKKCVVACVGNPVVVDLAFWEVRWVFRGTLDIMYDWWCDGFRFPVAQRLSFWRCIPMRLRPTGAKKRHKWRQR